MPWYISIDRLGWIPFYAIHVELNLLWHPSIVPSGQWSKWRHRMLPFRVALLLRLYEILHPQSELHLHFWSLAGRWFSIRHCLALLWRNHVYCMLLEPRWKKINYVNNDLMLDICCLDKSLGTNIIMLIKLFQREIYMQVLNILQSICKNCRTILKITYFGYNATK